MWVFDLIELNGSDLRRDPSAAASEPTASPLGMSHR